MKLNNNMHIKAPIHNFVKTQKTHTITKYIQLFTKVENHNGKR